MKQLDLIVTIVCVVLTGVAVGVVYGTKPEPNPVPAAPKVTTAPVALPAVNPVMTKNLPNGGGGGPSAPGQPGGGGGGGGKFSRGI